MQRTNQTLVTEFIFMAFSTVPELHVLLFLVFFVIYLGILLENTTLITIIMVDSRLHIPMYFFLCNMTLIEVGCTLATIPRMLIGLIMENNTISITGCAVQMFFFLGLGNASFLVVVVMAYDRYVAVCNPLRYKTIISDTVCLKLLAAVLIIGFLITLEQTILVFSVPYCGSNQINHFFCDVAQVLILAANCTEIFYVYEIVFNLIGILIFNIPFLIIVVSYIYIVLAILRIQTTEGRRKAFSSCSCHLTTVILQYVCLIFIYLRPKSSFLWDRDKSFVLIFTFISALVNRLIYSLRNKLVKSALKKAFSRSKLTCSR